MTQLALGPYGKVHQVVTVSSKDVTIEEANKDVMSAWCGEHPTFFNGHWTQWAVPLRGTPKCVKCFPRLDTRTGKLYTGAKPFNAGGGDGGGENASA